MDKTSAIIGINKWFYFCNNYDYYFIETIWGQGTSIANHLRGKFNGDMNKFYADLDSSNRLKLLTWVVENYNDEIKFKNI